MIVALIAINSAAWLAVHLSIATIVTRMRPPHFATDGVLPRVRSWEINLCRRWFRIRRWKRKLPDGASWIGGSYRKQSLATRNPADLRQLVIETRRGETAHWLMLACFPIFFMWNPPWAWSVMAAYAAAANLPCILVQRYNREVVQRMSLFRKDSSCGNVANTCEPPVFGR